MYSTNAHQQQPVLKDAGPPPIKEVPYEVEQPPPYRIHDQHNYPPPPTNAF